MSGPTVILMVGVSGSGKSTQVQKILNEAELADAKVVVCSADHEHIGPDGVYKFDPAKAALGHSNCFNKFLKAIREHNGQADIVIVDNTNVSQWERQNYEYAAKMAGCSVRYHVFVCDTVEKIKLCAARNTHGVPIGVIADMACRFDFDADKSDGMVTFHSVIYGEVVGFAGLNKS